MTQPSLCFLYKHELGCCHLHKFKHVGVYLYTQCWGGRDRIWSLRASFSTQSERSRGQWQILFQKLRWKLGLVVHTSNHNTWKTEARESVCLRPAWSTPWVPGLQGLCREPVSGKKEKRRGAKGRREIRIITLNEIDTKNSHLNLWL